MQRHPFLITTGHRVPAAVREVSLNGKQSYAQVSELLNAMADDPKIRTRLRHIEYDIADPCVDIDYLGQFSKEIDSFFRDVRKLQDPALVALLQSALNVDTLSLNIYNDKASTAVKEALGPVAAIQQKYAAMGMSLPHGGKSDAEGTNALLRLSRVHLHFANKPAPGAKSNTVRNTIRPFFELPSMTHLVLTGKIRKFREKETANSGSWENWDYSSTMSSIRHLDFVESEIDLAEMTHMINACEKVETARLSIQFNKKDGLDVFEGIAHALVKKLDNADLYLTGDWAGLIKSHGCWLRDDLIDQAYALPRAQGQAVLNQEKRDLLSMILNNASIRTLHLDGPDFQSPIWNLSTEETFRFLRWLPNTLEHIEFANFSNLHGSIWQGFFYTMQEFLRMIADARSRVYLDRPYEHRIPIRLRQITIRQDLEIAMPAGYRWWQTIGRPEQMCKQAYTLTNEAIKAGIVLRFV